MLKYISLVGGGLGPDTWDKEIEVDASNIREALDKIEALLIADGLSIDNITDIEQVG